jgi:tRNA G18 (ribose-2'-O)-methylase SpoU
VASYFQIDDAGDPRLSDFRDLADADVRPDRRGIVIAEGLNTVQRLFGSPFRVRAVLGVESRVAQLPAAQLSTMDVPVYVVDKWTLSDVVGFRVTRGVLASADRPAAVSPLALLADAQRVAVLESLNDFENLGALFRNAAAFGVDAVLLDPQCADPLYRRSVRVSMGHALRVPFAVVDDWPGGLKALRDRGFSILAMTPRDDAVPLRALAPPVKWAVLLGAEGPGLTAEAMAAADTLVRIPMAGDVDSLNVATAAAIAFAYLG